MPEPDFWIAKGDTQPVLRVRLIEGTEPKNLTGKDVTFTMEDKAGVKVIDGKTAHKEDPTTGIVYYAWADGETEKPGRYFGVFRVVQDDETFPNYGKIIIEVYEKRV